MQRRYTLRPPWKTMILACLFFGVCAAMFVYWATTGHRGLVIGGFIRLGPGGARTFYWVLAAMSFGMVLMGLLGVVRLAGGKLHVDIDDDGITLPGKPMRPRPHRFAFANITRASLSQVNRQRLLTIHDAEAKHWLAKSHLPDGEFEEIVAIVAQHVPPPRADLPVTRLR